MDFILPLSAELPSVLSGGGISQAYACLPHWIVGTCKCCIDSFPLQTLQSESLLLKNLVCIQQKVPTFTSFMVGPAFVHQVYGLWGFGCVGKGILSTVGTWRNKLEYSLSNLWNRLLLSLETHFFEVVFSTSFYTTASVNYKPWAFPKMVTSFPLTLLQSLTPFWDLIWAYHTLAWVQKYIIEKRYLTNHKISYGTGESPG